MEPRKIEDVFKASTGGETKLAEGLLRLGFGFFFLFSSKWLAVGGGQGVATHTRTWP